MNKKIEKILYMVFIFLIAAIFGAIVEILYQIILRGDFIISGFLYGPIRPIYGWGALLLYFIGKKFNKNLFVIFISSFIICSIFEYLSSYILEILFNRTWWDYSNFYLNINGRICLLISICWGILSTLFNFVVEPRLNKLYQKSNKKILYTIMCIVFTIYFIDSVASISNNIGRW